MSDAPATPEVQDEPTPIANYGMVRKTMQVDGEAESWAEVRFGENPTNPSIPAHVVEIRDVDMGDQFDLAEIAGNQVENGIWLSLAICAMSVQSFDGMPSLRGNLTKASLKQTLRKLGPTGVRAVRRGLAELNGPAVVDDPNAVKAAAGN